MLFSYELPGGGLITSTFYIQGKIRFSPTVQELRHSTTIRIIEDPRWNCHFKKVADFGCSELSLMNLLRNTNNIEHVLEIDIDKDILSMFKRRAEPLIADYVKKRSTPFRSEVLLGSIAAYDEKLANTDVVICLELIEHLEANILEKVPETVFGCIQPKLAIFSTPNSEYNILFNSLLPNGFRHYDHKFEWTRAEFEYWCLEICEQYPNYEVAFLGLGKAPPEHPDIGEVTQMAIFARKDILGKNLVTALIEKPFETNPQDKYEEISVNEFPMDVDDRTKEQKIYDEAQYLIQSLRFNEGFLDQEANLWRIPMRGIFEYGKSIDCEKEEILKILNNFKFNIENNFFILPYDENDEIDWATPTSWEDEETLYNYDDVAAAGHSENKRTNQSETTECYNEDNWD